MKLKLAVFLGWWLTVVPCLAENLSTADLRWVTTTAAPVECNAQPTAMAGEPAPDKAMYFTDYRLAAPFLKGISQYVYSFDRQYLTAISDLIGQSKDPDLSSIFVMLALRPYLAGLGYADLQAKVIEPAIRNLDCLNANFGFQNFDGMKNIPLFQKTALNLLIQSLQSGRAVYSEPQKQRAGDLVRALSDTLLQLTPASLEDLKKQRSALESFILELTANPFLRSREAADLAAAKFLLE